MPNQSDLRFSFTIIGGIAFEVIEFTLEEALSEPFHLALELSSHEQAIDFAQILDQPALFTLWRHDRPVRHVHGLVSSFIQGDTGFRRTRYRAVIEPRLARLALGSDWRIFQTRTVPEILATVLADYGLTDYEQSFSAEHLSREYCVQAGESDLAFLLRLAAEEGCVHHFLHRPDGHRLIHVGRSEQLPPKRNEELTPFFLRGSVDEG